MEGKFICGMEGEEETEQLGLAELPRHIKKCIFEKLPLESISRSNLVCKEWNYILSSRRFMASLPKSNPWLLLCAQDSCMAYCFSMHKWRKISLSFPPTLIGKNYSDFKFSSEELGLLLIQNHNLRRKDYLSYPLTNEYVCNPLTKDYAEIGSRVFGNVIGIVQGQSGDEPYLVTRFYDSRIPRILVYHYFEDSWRIKFDFQFSEKKDLAILSYRMCACNGVIFFGVRLPMPILGYNIRHAFIKPVRIEALPGHILEEFGNNFNIYPLTMGAYGLSVLVLLQNKDPLKSIIMLELFEDEEDEFIWKWREFATLPSTSLPFQGNYNQCIVVGDYLCFVRQCDKFVEVAAYNLKGGFWQSLPQCYIRYSDIRSFQPKLKVRGCESKFLSSL
ncbi:hypothetical protein SUGI_0989810 [Cryptomeria japonica]|nr:hypothetical protein SUGI_0989810 [Cryptomeria japonica]